jgi:hypothetical protein
MKKTLLFAAAGLMLSAAALAAPAGKTMGDNYVIPIKTGAPGENPESGRLNRTFTGESAKYSVIFQAAQRYYYQENEGIPRPPMNGTWKACLRFHVYDFSDEEGRGIGAFTFDKRDLLVERPVVLIWEYSGTYELSSDELYGAAIHELTHAMHFNMDTDLYGSIEKRVKESFAFGLQYYLTTQRYSDYWANHRDDYCTINQYADIMRDLADGDKMVSCSEAVDNDGNKVPSGFPTMYHDKISYAFTIPELVETVKTCKTPQDWYTRILTLYPNRVPIDVYLMDPFKFWYTDFEKDLNE